jgi:hypothetical protein
MDVLLPLLLTLPVFAPETVDPELLYRRMEERLLKAKTLTVKAQVRFEGDHRGESRAQFRLDREQQRLRYDRMMIPGRMERTVQVISDGQRIRSAGCSPLDEPVGPAFSGDAILIFLLWGLPEGIERIGWFCALGDPLIRPSLQEFKLVRREKIGTRATACISLTKSIAVSGGSWKREGKIWIDEATFLPVRRVEAHHGKCLQWTTTEDYEEIRFDEEMPANRFKLPD